MTVANSKQRFAQNAELATRLREKAIFRLSMDALTFRRADATTKRKSFVEKSVTERACATPMILGINSDADCKRAGSAFICACCSGLEQR